MSAINPEILYAGKRPVKETRAEHPSRVSFVTIFLPVAQVFRGYRQSQQGAEYRLPAQRVEKVFSPR